MMGLDDRFVVGDRGVPIGDSGEWIPFTSFSPWTADLSTTSTGYTGVGSPILQPLSRVGQIANVGAVGASLAGRVSNSDGTATTSARISFNSTGVPETEVTATGSGGLRWSEIGEIDAADAGVKIEMKTDTSTTTAQLRKDAAITLWIQLK